MTQDGESRPDFDTYFSDPALVKAYYIPTEQRQLTEKQKQLMISPRRIPEKECGDKQLITPETAAYLRQSDYRFNTEKELPSHPTPSPPSTVKFDESWPSTEHPTVLSGNRNQSTTGEENKSPDTNDSVISKYLRRFRHDPPQKRTERKVPPLNEFWWGPNSSRGDKYSSTSSKSCVSGNSQPANSTVGATDNSSSDRDFEVSSDATPKSMNSGTKAGKKLFEAVTPKTKVLMDRTNELLGHSDTIGSSASPAAVSSDGIGSSSGYSGPYKDVYHSTPEEDAVRPVLHRLPARANGRGAGPQARTVKSSSDKAGPEDDILYQWRLRRRLEQAQDRVKAAEKHAAATLTEPQAVVKVGADHRSMTAAASPHPQPNPPLPAPVQTPRVEQLVQTDAEIVQAGTQTTPTVDPISACTGPVADLQTAALKDRMSTVVPSICPSHHRCQGHCLPPIRCQPSAAGDHQCTRQTAVCPNNIREMSCSQQLSPLRRKECGCPPPPPCLPHQPCANINNSCVSPHSSDEARDHMKGGGEPSGPPTPGRGRRVRPTRPAVRQKRTGAKAVEKPSPVTSAISEVCKMRLFHSSPDVSEQTHRPREEDCNRSSTPQSFTSCKHAPTTTFDESSDGEFAADEMLSALRRKRAELVRRMRDLNSLLKPS